MDSMKKVYLSMLAATAIFSINASASTDLHSAFENGTTSGQIRYYYMNTDNAPGLKDYFGNTIGGHLKYQTQSFYDFKAGVAFYTSSFINTNVNAQSIEPQAGNKNSRYVIGLVDATNPANHSVTNVGELYLNYKYQKTNITIGRMKLKTPFMNPEDGRMIPTLEQGIWVNSNIFDELNIQLGYINAFWNRSTPGWKSVEDSIGYGYGQGLEPLEQKIKGDYLGHLSSNGLYVVGMKYHTNKDIKLQAWNYFAQNLFNLSYLQGNARKHIYSYQILAGLQYVYERAVGDGGNRNPALAYMRKNEVSQTYGAKVGAGYKHTVLTFAYTHTTDAGRFMFPRAWGKEALFTFQKRERSEGSGGVRAWLVTLAQNFKSFGIDGLKVKVGFGEYFKPSVANHILNKYAMPSYTQSNIDIHYDFHGRFKGLQAEYIFARKYALADTSNANFIFNKVNIDINNFILNYNF